MPSRSMASTTGLLCDHEMVHCTEHICLDDQSVHLHRRGGRQPTAIWLVHGLGDWAETWCEVLTSPTLAGWDLWAQDLPGFGRSARLAGPSPTVESLVARLVELIETLTPDRRVIVVGHSLGGVLVTLLAEQRPPWLAGVVNVEGNMTVEDCFISGSVVSSPDPRGWYEEFLGRAWAAADRGNEAMRRYAQGLEQGDQVTFLRCCRDLVQLSEGDRIGQRYQALAVPRLYCHGDALSVSSVAMLDQAAEAVRRFPGTSHWVQIDASDRFSSALATWLAETDRGLTSRSAKITTEAGG